MSGSKILQPLKLMSRQQSSHGSSNIAKNLTPIDENRLIEDDAHFANYPDDHL
jgi:hypothetical protein